MDAPKLYSRDDEYEKDSLQSYESRDLSEAEQRRLNELNTNYNAFILESQRRLIANARRSFTENCGRRMTIVVASIKNKVRNTFGALRERLANERQAHLQFLLLLISVLYLTNGYSSYMATQNSCNQPTAFEDPNHNMSVSIPNLSNYSIETLHPYLLVRSLISLLFFCAFATARMVRAWNRLVYSLFLSSFFESTVMATVSTCYYSPSASSCLFSFEASPLYWCLIDLCCWSCSLAGLFIA